MAWEWTHVRFAHDVKNRFDVSDLEAYYSGSIYPDSRYPSGIARDLTHDESFRQEAFYNQSDFHKGWMVHLLYDRVQFSVMGEDFTDILKEAHDDRENWQLRTALKILQDIDDQKQFSDDAIRQSVRYVLAPNSEDVHVLETYNTYFRTFYDATPVNVASYKDYFKTFGISSLDAESICHIAVDFQDRETVMRKVCNMYDRTMLAYEDFILE